jgi:plastocyanin
VQAWQSLVPTSTALTAIPQGTTEGSPLELDATITSNDTSTTMSGSVTFFYYTQYSGGGIDISAPLGTVPVTPVTTPTEGGTAKLMTHAPPGLVGSSQVGAFYGGDSHYLASWSAQTAVTASSTLAISPASVTVSPGQSVHFVATGGQAPFAWTFGTSSSTTTSSIDVNTGAYVASRSGPEQDSILVVDAYGAEALATVNILSSGPGDGGTAQDAGVEPLDAGMDDGGSQVDAPADAGTTHLVTTPPPRPDSPGCSCGIVGIGDRSDPEAAWIAAALALCATGRARRSSGTSSCATRRAPRRGS